ncbi:hypothetical protein [Streptomyces sp. NPDC058861]|uniref:hypothetical protein n=1 Tax=Streptomyces sp. NPDC058861 TaxID=3346653 RepID=UPI0036746B27
MKNMSRRTWVILGILLAVGALVITGIALFLAVDFARQPRQLSSVCDHGNRVYTLSQAGQGTEVVTVVPQDPTCG